MNDFAVDYAWQRSVREKLLIPHYEWLHGRKIFARWKSSETEYEQLRGDALFKLDDGSIIGVEEKIVRWPKRDTGYTAITLETMSCTVPGYEKPGWMLTGQYDWLLHVRVSADEKSAECDAFYFPNLQAWFNEQDHEQWSLHREKERNQTESRIVPLGEIRSVIRSFRFVRPGGGIGEIFGDTPPVYRCACGQWGSFGFGVRLLAGQEGTWYCAEHRPDRTTA